MHQKSVVVTSHQPRKDVKCRGYARSRSKNKNVCITMETGFQVVVGAALGCQLVPPVILFSPGWLQWMSLWINTAHLSVPKGPESSWNTQQTLTSSLCRFRCPSLRRNKQRTHVSLGTPGHLREFNECGCTLRSPHSLPTRFAREESRSSDTSFSGSWLDARLEPARVGFRMPPVISGNANRTDSKTIMRT